MDVKNIVNKYKDDFGAFSTYTRDFLIGSISDGIATLTPELPDSIKVKPATLSKIQKHFSEIAEQTKIKDEHDAASILARAKAVGPSELLRAQDHVKSNCDDAKHTEAVKHLNFLTQTASRELAVAGIKDLTAQIFASIEKEVEARKAYLGRRGIKNFITINRDGRNEEICVPFEYYKIKELVWLWVKLESDADEIESNTGYLDSQIQKAVKYLNFFAKNGESPL